MLKIEGHFFKIGIRGHANWSLPYPMAQDLDCISTAVVYDSRSAVHLPPFKEPSETTGATKTNINIYLIRVLKQICTKGHDQMNTMTPILFIKSRRYSNV